jgi:hypothetical protein
MLVSFGLVALWLRLVACGLLWRALSCGVKLFPPKFWREVSGVRDRGQVYVTAVTQANEGASALRVENPMSQKARAAHTAHLRIRRQDGGRAALFDKI